MRERDNKIIQLNQYEYGRKQARGDYCYDCMNYLNVYMETKNY